MHGPDFIKKLSLETNLSSQITLTTVVIFVLLSLLMDFRFSKKTY